MQKARRHPWLPPHLTLSPSGWGRGRGEGAARRAPTACRHVVSGSLSSPQRGSSHRSLALPWYAIGRRRVLSLAGWTPQLQTGFHVSGPTQVPGGRAFALRTGLSPAMVALSRAVPLAKALLTPSPEREPGPTTPSGRVQTVWARARSLAATRAVAFAFFS
jgi:hypothetical protein